jgi:hypothetical protein
LNIKLLSWSICPCLPPPAVNIRPLSCATDSVLVCGNNNGTQRNVDVDFEGSIVQVPAATKHSQQGGLFSATIATSIDSFAALQLINPANSGKTLRIEQLVGGATFPVRILIYRNTPILSRAPSVLSVNRNWNFPSGTSVGQAFFANDEEAGSLEIIQFTRHAVGYFELDFNEELIIPSNTTDDRNITINFIPTSGTVELDANIVWSETS